LLKLCDANLGTVKSDAYILKRFRNSKPSLIVHLHPTHFKFEAQEGSFSYKSPMRILIEHLKTRTIPHDLVEFLQDIPFYEGCMIVQIHDHKTTAASQTSAQIEAGVEKRIPFSVHNYNEHLTPSSYVPFQGNVPDKGKALEIEESKGKTSEQRDKENMPAPSVPVNGTSTKLVNIPQKPKVSTIVLRPTPLSNHVDLSIKVAESISIPEGRRDSRTEAGPLSATVPLTPITAVPPTPLTAMAPPAKRLKKSKAELDSSNIYAAESQIALATCAPLVLDPVNNAAESATLLKLLEHPMHSAKPPSPKSRKRTVAEMAADEAFAAEQERYMLIMDERLSSNATNAQGGVNPASGDGQAGGFEARFERFKTLENIKAQHEQTKREEKLRQAEAERKANQEREKERLRIESLKKDESQNQDKMRNSLAQQQAAATAARQQEFQRRQMLAQAAQAQAQAQAQVQQVMPGQMPNQHGHPQANNMITNGVHAQPQRFHQQQVSQAQASSPIVRNGTPLSHSSPTVNGIPNVPMQHTTSSMGGSPARPGSVVHQNHPQMGGPGPHMMTAQRSQTSHAGTPRMPNSTPIIQQTPLHRPVGQTPRMNQGSPVQGQMPQANMPNMPMQNGQMMTPQQQQHFHQQQQMQRLIQQQQWASNNTSANDASTNPPPTTATTATATSTRNGWNGQQRTSATGLHATYGGDGSSRDAEWHASELHGRRPGTKHAAIANAADANTTISKRSGSGASAPCTSPSSTGAANDKPEYSKSNKCAGITTLQRKNARSNPTEP
jgi:transcription factor SPT20